MRASRSCGIRWRAACCRRAASARAGRSAPAGSWRRKAPTGVAELPRRGNQAAAAERNGAAADSHAARAAKSFVEINAYDKSGSLRYGTAGYLGNGYFITVKHGVMALNDANAERRITSIKVL